MIENRHICDTTPSNDLVVYIRTVYMQNEIREMCVYNWSYMRM